jgi:hypothetical protein
MIITSNNINYTKNKNNFISFNVKIYNFDSYRFDKNKE